MKECELCRNPARMYCESDAASLCWDCDGNVHGANFLVAKHSRTLLCYVCQSPTPWNASGPKLGPTVSVCHDCLRRHCDDEIDDASAAAGLLASRRGIYGEPVSYNLEDGYDQFAETDDDGEYSDDDEEEEEGDNQVVPWSSSPVVSSSSFSTSEEFSSFRMLSVGDTGGGSSSNPMIEFHDADSQNEIGCRSQHNNNNMYAGNEFLFSGIRGCYDLDLRMYEERNRVSFICKTPPPPQRTTAIAAGSLTEPEPRLSAN